uniref:SAP domain-containing protein n=1 Tax=Pygocentrus nattereri TaxID=42514 RepID=A0A3B4CXA7_PYGNA
MAELEDVTLDGKPLHSLRVADLKAALEQRGLAKSGQKNALIKRLKGALMLENLQRTSTPHAGLQPNSQIGEEMSQNSFIKQYLAKQQELLRQRMEREAREAAEADDSNSPAGPEEEDHAEANDDDSSYLPEKVHDEGGDHGGGLPQDPGLPGARRLDVGSAPVAQQPSDASTGRIWQPSFSQEEVATPSPPRAVASLSVRVVGQPERQGLVPRPQEREGTAPVEAGPAHSMPQLSQSAHTQEESDDDEDDDDDSDEDDEWGPSHRRKNARAPPVHHPPAASAQRSRRKLQPPQHIPPQPQPVHHSPLQLRQPTPPPSPPPELSFPMPDTPKQSPPDQDEPAAPGEGARAGMSGASSPPPLQRQESSSSSGSSSPEPPSQRRPGPLSLLVRKMESEGAFDGGQKKEEEEEADGAMEEADQEDAQMEMEANNSALEISRGEDDTHALSGAVAPPGQQDLPQEELPKEPELVATTLSTTPPPVTKRPRMFSEVPPPECLLSPSKPEQVSVLVSGPRHADVDVAMETEECAAAPELTPEKDDDKDMKPQAETDKPASPQAPEAGEDTQRTRSVLPPSPPPEEGEAERAKPKPRKREKSSERHSSSSSHSSSSESDSESSSSTSSGSSPQDKSSPPSKKKVSVLDVKQAAVAEPTGPVAMELEERPESQSTLAQPAPQGAPETAESRPDESTTPKAFAARKISLTSTKPEGASLTETESGGGASRKRRWGSSTAVTAKKPSISITTDCYPLEAVVELHPDEGRFSGDEDSSQQVDREEDQGLKIRRTVTQVVPSEGQENGQKEKEVDEDEEEEEEEQAEGEKEKPHRNQRESLSEVAVETQGGDAKKVTPNDSLVRRSISQQKVSVAIDDPVRTGRQLSPPRGKVSNIIHICNLVRPFTLGQLKELLNRTGTVVEESFWIDKIKSHCYVTYSSKEEAVATCEALHGVKWPSSNPKVLRVDFCEQDEVDFHKGLLTGDDPRVTGPVARPAAAPPPLMPPARERERERERERDIGTTAVRDQWAEREREMERRERTRSEREWDRDKVRDFGRDDRDAGKRSRSRDRRRKERGKSKERKAEKKEKPEEPPAKLLDDLFRKTKAAPCIYWLPLTEEQAAQRSLERAERMKEREKRRKELQEEEDKKREEERKERVRAREREGGNAVSGSGSSNRPAEGERDKERERERERERGREKEGEKRRDSNRGRASDSKPSGGSRRSRSRSNPSRDRRR